MPMVLCGVDRPSQGDQYQSLTPTLELPSTGAAGGLVGGAGLPSDQVQDGISCLGGPGGGLLAGYVGAGASADDPGQVLGSEQCTMTPVARFEKGATGAGSQAT